MNIPSNLRIVFAGTPVFAEKILSVLLTAGHDVVAVYTQPDKPAGRGHKLVASPVKQLALTQAIPVYQPKTLRDPLAQAELKVIEADLMIVAAYGLILPQTVLDIPVHGCLNVHASLLPRWRGAAPIQRAILAGDTYTGVTIMQMTAGLDTGPMLNTLTCPIESHDTSASLHDKLAVLGGAALLTSLAVFADKGWIAEKQDDTLATYAHKIEKEEAQVDWQQSAEQIERQIRAFQPWPVAYCHAQDKTVRLWSAEVLDQPASGPPGTICQANKNGIDVATGSGQLRLKRVQFSGQKPWTIVEVLNGYSHYFTVGTQLN